ncbi:hypothetical protein AB3538_07430 [Acinetobacter baumannii]
MPNGWEVSTVGEQVQTVGGGTPSTKNVDFGTMVFTIGQHLKTYQI